ncbi:hypothetical protein F5Y18DRAFT_397134 [Xylariaceae sp. FL1019]|nr:hypothetical protein F5Y18DRAFT_397134 [Xylariaceae sp. FL1019]
MSSMAEIAQMGDAEMDIDFEQPPQPQPRIQDTTTDAATISTMFQPQQQPQDGQDDDSEWEYEYSTAETETFYVTLDLSKEDFRSQYGKSRLPFASRGAWPVHKAMAGFVNRRDGARPGTSSSNSDAEPGGEDEGDGENSNDEGEATTPPDRDPTPSTTANPDRVQILDLHTTEPMVSYKGRIFTGQWYTNTTTELLLTQHDPHIPLPFLRHLPDSVDLLAASSARINVVEKKLKRSDQERKRALASMRTSAMILPPVDKNATEERIDQRNFLANLMAIKKRKGETDEVTVIARSMQAANKRSRYLKPRGPRGGRILASHIYRRIRDDEGKGGKSRAGRKKGSRARGRLAWNVKSVPLGQHHREDGQADEEGEGGDEGEDEDMLSMPTPAHWGDLEEIGGDGKTTRPDSGGEDGNESPGEDDRDVEGRSEGSESEDGSEDRDQDENDEDNEDEEEEEDDEDMDVDEEADVDAIQYYTQDGDNDEGEDDDQDEEDDEDDDEDSDDTDENPEIEDDNEDGEDGMSEVDDDSLPP